MRFERGSEGFRRLKEEEAQLRLVRGTVLQGFYEFTLNCSNVSARFIGRARECFKVGMMVAQ